jgi:hypothetical protein
VACAVHKSARSGFGAKVTNLRASGNGHFHSPYYSHSNRKIGVRRFHREIIFKRRNIIHFVIFGNSIEIGLILISDNSGASGSSGGGEPLLKIPLRTAVHPSDHLKSLRFSCALFLKVLLFSLHGVSNSEPACDIRGRRASPPGDWYISVLRWSSQCRVISQWDFRTNPCCEFPGSIDRCGQKCSCPYY